MANKKEAHRYGPQRFMVYSLVNFIVLTNRAHGVSLYPYQGERKMNTVSKIRCEQCPYIDDYRREAVKACSVCQFRTMRNLLAQDRAETVLLWMVVALLVTLTVVLK